MYISADAKKAFNRVEFNYLFEVLNRFRLGDVFISWIRLLYASSKANIYTNGIQSNFFSLSRGNCQGCPLSALLFVIAIEPLSIYLRSSQIYREVTRSGIELKLSLYADDLLLYVKDPGTSIPYILAFLKRFGSFSGYKVNISRSECYSINQSVLQLTQSDIPFKLSPSGFKYLGINVTRLMSSLFSANFSPLVSNLKADLQRWESLPLSLIGRINTIKMTILPKFLFLFQCLPIFLTRKFFKDIDQTLSGFLWSSKTPRIRKNTSEV